MNSETDNMRAVFNGGYIYICKFCGKSQDSIVELKLHLDEIHEEFDYDDITLDGPQYKVRKLKYYQDQLSSLSSDLQTISIIDLIEAPLCQLSNDLESFSKEQRGLCMLIRQRERPQCSFSSSDDLLPMDDPLEVEYQMLRRKHAAKLREYEENLRLEKLKIEELRANRERLAEFQKFPQ